MSVATAADVVVQSKKQQHAAAAEDSGESFEDVLKGVSAQVRTKVYHLHFGFCAFIYSRRIAGNQAGERDPERLHPALDK